MIANIIDFSSDDDYLSNILNEKLKNTEEISVPVHERTAPKRDLSPNSIPKFSFKSFFTSFNAVVNTANPETDSIDDIAKTVTKSIRHTRASPFLRILKKQIRDWQKSKKVSKFLKTLSKSIKKSDSKQSISDKSSDEFNQKLIGAILMSIAQCDIPQRASSVQANAKSDEKGSDEDSDSCVQLCAHCGDEIEGNLYQWWINDNDEPINPDSNQIPWTDQFVCEDCEDECKHQHFVYYKKSGMSKKQKKKLTEEKRLPITNFPVFEGFGKDWSVPQPNAKSTWIANTDLICWEEKGDKNARSADTIKSRRTRQLRPTIIQAPEGALIGNVGECVVADFVIQNQSEHPLPKVLYLKTRNVGDIEFETIKDTDALGPSMTKTVSLVIKLPMIPGSYRCVFNYENINQKILGGDFIWDVIAEEVHKSSILPVKKYEAGYIPSFYPRF